ncbi:ABC transporter ATP-binding protein [Vandammella animalimorsus]|uniref:ABC transporter ATP-binding protein n=1 Tax=Vandammella animalimorsus TaxID=2029117 RepID=UPI0031BB1029
MREHLHAANSAAASQAAAAPSTKPPAAPQPAPPTSTPPARELIFRAQGLTKVYGAGEVQVQALRGIDLELHAGEFVVLLGPSGSGKSTLLNILGGLDVPSSGQVWYCGQDLSRASDAALTRFRREHVGFVFQFYNLIPSLTARENVAIVTEIAPDPLDPAQALALVGLDKRLEHFPAQLSGGEQQRVAIARAIAKRPAVMLCDEPTGALDSATGVLVLQALERVNAEMGTTTVIITHNADIARMAERVLWMQDGQIVREQRNAQRLAAQELRW